MTQATAYRKEKEHSQTADIQCYTSTTKKHIWYYVIKRQNTISRRRRAVGCGGSQAPRGAGGAGRAGLGGWGCTFVGKNAKVVGQSMWMGCAVKLSPQGHCVRMVHGTGSPADHFYSSGRTGMRTKITRENEKKCTARHILKPSYADAVHTQPPFS